MKQIKAILEQNEKKFPLKKHISKICGLEEIDNSCSWKSYEGLTPQLFMQSIFPPIEKNLQKNKGCFIDKLANSCMDIAFVKVNIRILKKQEWVAVYLFRNDEKISFAFGGEPLVNIEKEYSRFLTDFWSVHSFWYFRLNTNSIDLSYAFMGLGKVELPHPINFVSSYEQSLLYEHQELFEKYTKIEGIEKFDREKTKLKSPKERHQYLLSYLKKAVVFKKSPTTSYTFLVKDSQEKDYIFEAGHDWKYFLYDGFEEYLKLDRVNGL